MTYPTIESGIYRHFKGNLYFVLALAWSHQEPTNPDKAEVIYHPLYPVENLGWRRDRTLIEFFEHVERPEFQYCGPRFVKVADWETPNILPGMKRRVPKDDGVIEGTIEKIVDSRDKNPNRLQVIFKIGQWESSPHILRETLPV